MEDVALENLKKFLGVSFTNGENDVVPKCWLTPSSSLKKRYIFYPEENIKELASMKVSPDTSWPKYKVKILCNSSKFTLFVYAYIQSKFLCGCSTEWCNSV